MVKNENPEGYCDFSLIYLEFWRSIEPPIVRLSLERH